MEALTLLQYWSSTAGTATFKPRTSTSSTSTSTSTTSSASPFFDLQEFILTETHDIITFSQLKPPTKIRLLFPERGNHDEVFTLEFDFVKGPLVSLFKRNSAMIQDSDHELNSGRKMLLRYLIMVKHFYVRVSKRWVEKMKLSGKGGGNATVVYLEKGCAAAKGRKSHLRSGLKVMLKHLGQSCSACTAAAPPPPGKTESIRRADSLEEKIQAAILHCKKSFNCNRIS